MGAGRNLATTACWLGIAGWALASTDNNSLLLSAGKPRLRRSGPKFVRHGVRHPIALSVNPIRLGHSDVEALGSRGVLSENECLLGVVFLTSRKAVMQLAEEG